MLPKSDPPNLSADRVRPISLKFVWTKPSIHNNGNAETVRRIAKTLGINYHAKDYIRIQGSSERASRLVYGHTYYYMSHYVDT